MFRTATNQLNRAFPHYQIPRPVSAADSPLYRFIQKLSAIEYDTNLHQHLIAIQNEENENLLRWANIQLNLATQQSPSISCEPARQAAQTETLICALLETCCYLKKYKLGKFDDELVDCIEPEHRKLLTENFQASFYSADESSKLNIVAALADQTLEKMGIEVNPVLQMQASEKHTLCAAQNFLNQSELLALLDYVNSSTGIFNIVSTAGRAEAYYGIDFFQHVIHIYTDALRSALDKLHHNTDFSQNAITIFKGIHLGKPNGIFCHAHLEHAYHHGSLIAFPHPISGTTDENESYANTKYDQGYHYELALSIPVGANVDAFHDTKTRGQKENIAPAGLRFIVTEKYQREVRIASTGSIGCIEGYKLRHVCDDE